MPWEREVDELLAGGRRRGSRLEFSGRHGSESRAAREKKRVPCCRGVERHGRRSCRGALACCWPWSRGHAQEKDRERARLEVLLACRERTAALHPCRASDSRGERPTVEVAAPPPPPPRTLELARGRGGDAMDREAPCALAAVRGRKKGCWRLKFFEGWECKNASTC
uniref:Uncharacterized protein n=1 Tax=Zea mays TaxID=4577 RepID=A0A804U7G6_MAIZE